MDMRSLRQFVEVARQGGFAPVARQTRQDPSSVSRSIAQLEKELGARLFQRTTRQVSLTEEGERFLARIEPVLAEMELAVDEMRDTGGQPAGRLRMTTSVAFGQIVVIPQLKGFMDRYPAIDIELVLSDSNVDLIDERIDLAIRLGPSVDSSLIGSRLCSVDYRVCASPDYQGTTPSLAAPAMLAGVRCVAFDLPNFRTRWRFRDHEGRIEEVSISPGVIVSSAVGLREACLHGLGPALLPDWLVRRDLEAGRLVDLFPEVEATATNFESAAWLLYPSRAFLPRKTRAMVDYLREAVGDQRR